MLATCTTPNATGRFTQTSEGYRSFSTAPRNGPGVGRAGRTSRSGFELARHVLRHFQIVGSAAGAQTGDDAVAVLNLAVLAHFPFAFEPRDGKAKADDAAQHGFDIALGRVRQRPRLCRAALLLRGQFADVAAQPAGFPHRSEERRVG